MSSRVIGKRYQYKIIDLQQITTEIFCIMRLCTNEKYEIHIRDDDVQIIQVENFQGFTWRPRKPINISDDFDVTELRSINFEKTPRHKDKRPVWLLCGLKENTSIITDSIKENRNVPSLEEDFITSDIIEVGDKPIESIIERCIGSNEYIRVTFTSYNESTSQRKVLIFCGASNMGKSFVSHSTSLTVYETDISSVLPDKLLFEIIVIGQRFKFTIEEIISHCEGDAEYIIVEFSSI